MSASGVSRIFRDFSGWTSAHGIPHIGSAQNKGLQCFWILVFFGSTSAFAYNLSELVKRYSRFDVTVQTELKFEERKFPAVTLCNHNPYRKARSTVSNELNNLVLSKVTNSSAQTDLMFIGRHLSHDQKQLLTYRLSSSDFRETFVLSCAYNTKPCKSYLVEGTNQTGDGDFVAKFTPHYGYCYIFNDLGKYSSTRAGPLYGLRLLALSNQAEYLPSTKSAGIRVAVHAQKEEAFPDAFGYSAAAGFTTSFGVKFIKTLRLPHPYGKCKESESSSSKADYFYEGPYSVEGCFRSCSQRIIYTDCTCGDPRYALPPATAGDPNPQYCPFDKTDPKLGLRRMCVEDFVTNKTKSDLLIKSCQCNQPCEESTYFVTVSTALWPSEVYVPPECKQNHTVGLIPWLPIGTDTRMPQEDREVLCVEWYRRNTMLIEVYYERMNYQQLSESPAYTEINMISDIGGQLGLWLGVSVITMIEFLSFLVLVCIYIVKRPKIEELQMLSSDEEEDGLNRFNKMENKT